MTPQLRENDRRSAYRRRSGADRSGRDPRVSALRPGQARPVGAHPLEYDESGFPIAQPRLGVAERLRRLVTG
jgi:hypothetical protein